MPDAWGQREYDGFTATDDRRLTEREALIEIGQLISDTPVHLRNTNLAAKIEAILTLALTSSPTGEPSSD